MIHGLHEGKFKIDRTKAQRLGSGINFMQYEISFCVCFHADVGLFPQD